MIFKVGDRVVGIHFEGCPDLQGRVGTVAKAGHFFGDAGQMLDIRWDDVGWESGGWYSYRFKLLATTPFEKSLQSYIQSELD